MALRSGAPAFGEWSSLDTAGARFEVGDLFAAGAVGGADAATEADALTEVVV